jgi:lysophospholipase L1-like esterase
MAGHHEGVALSGMMRRTLIPVLVSIGVTVLLLLAAEIGVRLMGVEPMEWPGIEGQIRFKGTLVDPLLGPRLRPGWSGRWPGKFAVSADEHGFRTTGLPAPESPAARVAFMGDSCSFGWGLDTEQTFVALLDARQRSAGTPALALWNAAYPGTSAVAGEYVLREHVLPLRPDVVVLGFSANNAFRFADVNDATRFRSFGIRKMLLRSRLWSIAAAWLANRNPPKHNPRTRSIILDMPVHALSRVATLEQFTAAVRAMVADTRASGAEPIFLVFPRASAVSTLFPQEDAGLVAARLPPPVAKPGKPTAAEISLLEASCLDHQALNDPIQEMRSRAPAWRPVYPAAAEMRERLRQGALAYSAGRYDEATRLFSEAVALQGDVPLAHYDLGAALLANGRAEGLAEFDTADRLACSVFLSHQIALWRLAHELHVPVVDLALHFQAHDGAALFMDPAHPNAAGDQIIADALWPVLQPFAVERAKDT